MTDQHAHAGYAPHDGYSPGGFETDPLFGTLPDPYGAGHLTDHHGPYEPAQWDTATHPSTGYGTHAAPQYTTGQWTTVGGVQAGSHLPADPLGGTEQVTTDQVATGQWDIPAWQQADPFKDTSDTGQFESAAYRTAPCQSPPYGYEPAASFDTSQFPAVPPPYEAATQWAAPAFDTGAYDATAWNPAQDTLLGTAVVPGQFAPESPAEPEPRHRPDSSAEQPGPEYGGDGDHDPGLDDGAGTSRSTDREYDEEPEHAFGTAAEPGTTSGHPAPGTDDEPTERGPDQQAVADTAHGSRGRRRTPARRSALLTIAVPSACVMGVAGIAAMSVGGLSSAEERPDDSTSTAAAEAASVKTSAVAANVAANNEMDTQLAALSADARDFGDRAGRTQERIDLKERKDAEKQKRKADAARKEALRPKFVLPVSQHGLSAYFGQPGVNWMSVHTGIDFPVSYGTPVKAATDGTVRTERNNAYGNMAIVTSPDGTETWYCHLSSTKIRSGSVKAGDVIAYSGNSGNSTGPHLHFEVRPGAGRAIDPLPWLRSHSLDPS